MTTPALIGRLACVAGVALAFLGGLCLPAVFPIAPVPPLLLPLVLLTAAGLIGLAVYQFRAEAAALRAETRLLESAVVHARDAVVVLEGEPAAGPGRRVLYANDAFCRMTGYTRAEVIGRSLHHLRGPDSDESTLDQIRDALAAGRPFQTELRNRRKDGSGYWVELSLVPVPGSAGRTAHWVMIQRDITDRKRTEGQLREARKLEAVGRLAGGIAHDFNNLMTGVIGNLALVRLPENDPNRPLLAAAEQAAARVADLTRKLLGYAGRSQIMPGPVDPGELLEEAAAVCRDPRVRVEVSVAPGCGPILADRSLLGQALASLCENARDAMPAGGTLTLSADPVEAIPPPDPDDGDPQPGSFVRVRVADTGDGMTDDAKAHIFEPFFTTKGPDKGTGLGLPMVLGITQQHKGWVDCTSAPGAGTRIDLYLPAADASTADTADVLAPETATALRPVRTPPALPRPGPRSAADTPPPAAGTTVLLVDDEEMVRNVGRLILERAGYRVLTAADGQEAVEVFARERGRVGLVVLDVNMPRMSGPEAFRRIHDLAPTARVLFLTGFAAEELAELEGAAGVLAKPYRPPELLAAVRDALATSAGTGTN